jgi:hypothetical protein
VDGSEIAASCGRSLLKVKMRKIVSYKDAGDFRVNEIELTDQRVNKDNNTYARHNKLCVERS